MSTVWHYCFMQSKFLWSNLREVLKCKCSTASITVDTTQVSWIAVKCCNTYLQTDIETMHSALPITTEDK